jgi:hypothetical protein
VEVSTSDLLGFKSMLLKQTPNSKLSPIKMLPCDINCNKNHGASDVGALCFECGREWGQHSGHRCITGDRGSWNVPVCFPSSISMRELFGKTSISSQLLHFIDIQEVPHVSIIYTFIYILVAIFYHSSVTTLLYAPEILEAYHFANGKSNCRTYAQSKAIDVY